MEQEKKVNVNASRILIVDDEETIRDACSQVFEDRGYLVDTAENGEIGLKKFADMRPDLVFIDLKMPGISGMDVLEKIHEADENVVTIVITGYATIESAVESMKKGAFDFLPKPFTIDELQLITQRAMEKRNLMLERLQLETEKERMRQNFISLVSHELRTPLVAVIQYMEVLTGGMAGVLSEQQAKIMGRMKIRLNELLLLINRWLKYARIEELKLKEGFTEFSLGTVVEESIELIRPLAREKKINLDFVPHGGTNDVFGDRDMIKEVCLNLINNGVKYNKEGGWVKVALRDVEDFIAVDVSDDGVGINEQDIARVGEEFYRIKREGLAAGSGLGLAIVKKILDAHDGKMEVKSELNKGSTFSVYLKRVKKGGKRSEA